MENHSSVTEHVFCMWKIPLTGMTKLEKTPVWHPGEPLPVSVDNTELNGQRVWLSIRQLQVLKGEPQRTRNQESCSPWQDQVYLRLSFIIRYVNKKRFIGSAQGSIWLSIVPRSS